MNILFVDGTAGHDPHQRIGRPTGGILNSLTLIPEHLVKKGHTVYVASSYNKNEIVNGVHYFEKGTQIPKWDVVVFNRDVLPKDMVLYSKELGAKVVWWLHDCAQLGYLKDDAYRYVDKVIALSMYCKETYSDFYSIPADMFSVIPNGVEKSLFHPGEYEKRNKNLFITASAPIKGTMPLICTIQNLKKINPDVDFRIYSSQKLHNGVDTASHQKFLEMAGAEGAHIYAPVSQEVLAQLFRKAYCLLMPNSYPEICSNLLLQARASGLPVVTSNIGSAAEFVGGGGLMTERYYPHDTFNWIVEYTNLVLDVALKKDLHKKLATADNSDVLSWDAIGEKWNDTLVSLVEESAARV